MSNNELKGKMVMVPRTMYGREHVAYCAFEKSRRTDE